MCRRRLSYRLSGQHDLGGRRGVEHPGVERVEDDLGGAVQLGQRGALDEGLGVLVDAEEELVQLLLAERPVPALHPRRHAQLLVHRPLEELRVVQLVVRVDTYPCATEEALVIQFARIKYNACTLPHTPSVFVCLTFSTGLTSFFLPVE